MKANKFLKITMLYFAVLIFVVGCVPARKYEDLLTRRQTCEDENAALRVENEKMFSENNEFKSLNDQNEKNLITLKNDTAYLGTALRNTRAIYQNLNSDYQGLLSQYRDLLAGRNAETERILKQLQVTQEDLQKREDELRKSESQMNEKQKNLDVLQRELEISKADIQSKEIKLNELQRILSRQDSIVQALRRKLGTALMGFEGKGLTIEMKNGKVYVSLEESLLFASGSYNVDQRGVSALKELAKVLETNKDINVLIEGHTDDVPLRGSGQIKDNWDLSVMRATSIVKILLQHGKIDPSRLTAAGRAEFMPLDPAKTTDARRKNRRTEIILTPKLDELFKIIESN